MVPFGATKAVLVSHHRTVKGAGDAVIALATGSLELQEVGEGLELEGGVRTQGMSQALEPSSSSLHPHLLDQLLVLGLEVGRESPLRAAGSSSNSVWRTWIRLRRNSR